MSSRSSSAFDSALASAYSSRSQTPLPPPPVQAPNPYRLPRFWRGYVLGGLSLAGAAGLYKLGSFIKNYINDKFHRQQIPAIAPYAHNQYQALSKPTPYPTPYQRRNIKMQENRHN